MFLRAGMTGRLREAGPVTLSPLGGDSVSFGSATLGVSVSLARCQRARRLSSSGASRVAWSVKGLAACPTLHAPTNKLSGVSHELLLQGPRPPTSRGHSTSSNSTAFSASQRGFLSGPGHSPLPLSSRHAGQNPWDLRLGRAYAFLRAPPQPSNLFSSGGFLGVLFFGVEEGRSSSRQKAAFHSYVCGDGVVVEFVLRRCFE